MHFYCKEQNTLPALLPYNPITTIDMSGGQFDDAETEEVCIMGVDSSNQSDDDFIKSMRDKLLSNKEQQVDPADNNTYEEEDDDDYYNDDEEDDLLLDPDTLLHTKGSHNNLTSTDSTSHKVSTSISKMQNLSLSKKTSHTGRDDRATSEQCLDPRTRLILFKLLSNGFLELIDGCLSTGKEANVYYGKAGRIGLGGSSSGVSSSSSTSSNNDTTSSSVTTTSPAKNKNIATYEPNTSSNITEYAIKIYKTSILVFKDRDKYVSGEHRWRKGYCKSNPRKMVKVWAEKEMVRSRIFVQICVLFVCAYLLCAYDMSSFIIVSS